MSGPFTPRALTESRWARRALRLARAAHARLLDAHDWLRETPLWPAPAASDAPHHDVRLRRAEARLARIAARAGGRMGVAALHVETGRGVSLNGGLRFPMASVVKLPAAVHLLALVDEGKLTLERTIALEPRHVVPGGGLIANRLRVPGAALSVHNLLELMLVDSDNSASDVLLELVGGASAVSARLRALGVTQLSVDRSILRLFADLAGLAELPPDGPYAGERWAAIRAAVPPERRAEARRAYLSDLRDTGTPQAVVGMLATIQRREALSHEGTALLLDILRRCATGPQRLKGLLPSGTHVAHKTGSLAVGVCNDAGIIELPGGAGHVAVAVFLQGSHLPRREQDRMVARAARAVYDCFAAPAP